LPAAIRLHEQELGGLVANLRGCPLERRHEAQLALRQRTGIIF